MINKYINYIFYNNSFIIKNRNRFFIKLVYKDYNSIISIFTFYKFKKIYNNTLLKFIKY